MATVNQRASFLQEISDSTMTLGSEDQGSIYNDSASTIVSNLRKRKSTNSTDIPGSSAIKKKKDSKAEEVINTTDIEGEDEFRAKNKTFSDSLEKAFLPVKYLLIGLGRFPLTWKVNEHHMRVYSWNWKHPNMIYFIFVTILASYCLIFGTWNIFAILMEVNVGRNPINQDFNYEKAIVQRHFVTFVLLWTSLVHVVISSVSFLVKRENFALFLTFWSQTVQIMHMDVGKGMFILAIRYTVIYIFSLVVLIFLSIFRFSPSATTAPTVFGILLFRDFVPALYSLDATRVNNSNGLPVTLVNNDTTGTHLEYEVILGSSQTTILTFLGALFCILIFACSKVYMILFIFKCKLLRNAFAHWNGRVFVNVLKGGEQVFQTEEGKTAFTILFRDHCYLLDLLEAMDHLWTSVMESYFGLQILSICVELYFFVRTFSYGEKRDEAADDKGFFIRPYDWTAGGIVFLQSIYILVVVCYAAAEVGEEANAGMEVIRRRSLMGRKTDEELYFVLTMFTSYTSYKRIEVAGGGYFYLNKEFLIGILSTIFSYFIIIYQFAPKLDYNTAETEEKREIFGKFLTILEGIQPEDHYMSSINFTTTPKS